MTEFSALFVSDWKIRMRKINLEQFTELYYNLIIKIHGADKI